MPRETDGAFKGKKERIRIMKASECERGLEKTFMDMMEQQGVKFVDVTMPPICFHCKKEMKPAYDETAKKVSEYTT